MAMRIYDLRYTKILDIKIKMQKDSVLRKSLLEKEMYQEITEKSRPS